MLKKLAVIGTALSLLLPFSVGAQTDNTCTVTSMAGDNDYFGGDCFDMKHEPEDGVFDSWDRNDKYWNHTYPQITSGGILSAKLEIVMYTNIAYEPDADLGIFVNGQQVSGGFNLDPTKYAVQTYVINLDSSFFPELEKGIANIEVRNIGTKVDHFGLDYAELKIEYKCNTTTEVNIDIKPGSDPSSFGVNSKGKIPVALFGSATFDVNLVDDSTVRFGSSAESGAYSSIKAGLEDVNGDGFMDKVYHFNFPETNLGSTDTVAYLSGTLVDGTSFEGSSDINIVGGNEKLPVAPDEEVIEVDNNGKKVKVKTKK